MSARQDSDTEAVVYVRILDEGTDVWQPVRAKALRDGTFRLVEPGGYDPAAKGWEFPPRTTVRCVAKNSPTARKAWSRSRSQSPAPVEEIPPIRTRNSLEQAHRCHI